jgi:hypothetical protein
MVSRITAVSFLALCATGITSATDDGWNLRRNTSNGACSVQLSTSMPQLGAFLASHPTRKETCQDGQSRKTDDPGDSTKCLTYTQGSIDICAKDGIALQP